MSAAFSHLCQHKDDIDDSELELLKLGYIHKTEDIMRFQHNSMTNEDKMSFYKERWISEHNRLMFGLSQDVNDQESLVRSPPIFKKEYEEPSPHFSHNGNSFGFNFMRSISSDSQYSMDNGSFYNYETCCKLTSPLNEYKESYNFCKESSQNFEFDLHENMENTVKMFREAMEKTLTIKDSEEENNQDSESICSSSSSEKKLTATDSGTTITNPTSESTCRPILMWQFIKDLLNDPRNMSIVTWLNRDNGEFKIIDSGELARLWGKRKNRPAMNFDKMSRSMRQYYKKKIMVKGNQRLVYQFCHPFHL